MRCPRCNADMQTATLGLKAWGWGGAPSARLWLDEEILLVDQYIPVLGLFRRRGKKLAASHCESCHLVTFEYDPARKPTQFRSPFRLNARRRSVARGTTRTRGEP